jgi:hypothetical protein
VVTAARERHGRQQRRHGETDHAPHCLTLSIAQSKIKLIGVSPCASIVP